MTISALPDVPGKDDILTGLAGRDILSSRSPWMHEQEALGQGLRLGYTLFDFTARGWADADLPALLADAAGRGFAGLNITFPFKQQVIAHLDDLSDGARAVGAVNTVSFANGQMTGHNTDVTGFATSFSAGLPGAALDHVVQIGCGGAGAATAHAILSRGAKRLTLIDADATRCASLASRMAAEFEAEIVTDVPVDKAMATADGLINATPMGMARYPGLPLPAVLLAARHWVADIVYFPLETALLREAERVGCRTLSGAGMAVHQAAAAFEIFTGRVAECARMDMAFRAFTGSPKAEAA